MADAGWLAFSIPHFVFHMVHLDGFGATDKIGPVVALAGTVILAVLLRLPTAGPCSGRPASSAAQAMTRTPCRTFRDAN
jgi:hypothetical protein